MDSRRELCSGWGSNSGVSAYDGDVSDIEISVGPSSDSDSDDSETESATWESLSGLWACPHCGSVIASESPDHPPGHENAQEGITGCAACKVRKIAPEDWMRVHR